MQFHEMEESNMSWNLYIRNESENQLDFAMPINYLLDMFIPVMGGIGIASIHGYRGKNIVRMLAKELNKLEEAKDCLGSIRELANRHPEHIFELERVNEPRSGKDLIIQDLQNELDAARKKLKQNGIS